MGSLVPSCHTHRFILAKKSPPAFIKSSRLLRACINASVPEHLRLPFASAFRDLVVGPPVDLPDDAAPFVFASSQNLFVPLRPGAWKSFMAITAEVLVPFGASGNHGIEELL